MLGFFYIDYPGKKNLRLSIKEMPFASSEKVQGKSQYSDLSKFCKSIPVGSQVYDKRTGQKPKT